MPHTARARAFLRLMAALLACTALLLCAPLHALASEPKPTRLPQPTRDPAAEPYDSDRPELLSPDMLIASSAILIEASTGEAVFEKNADEIRYPASTTKILTALLAIQSMEFDPDMPEEVYISAAAANQPSDASLIPVSEGEEINIRDLLFATMLRSGNDGAAAIAEYIAGSQSAFVDRMNDTAAFLGCTNTHFTNPHGYQDPDHYTTARDMAIIAQAAMKSPLFREIAAASEYLMPRSDKHPVRRLSTTNSMIIKDQPEDIYYPYAIGIKTGFHSDAMYCLVGAAQRDGVELISVVFYTSDKGRWVDTQRLMDYGFSQFESTTPMQLYRESPRILNVSGFDLADAKSLGRLELAIRPAEGGQDIPIVGRKDEIESIRRNFDRLSQVLITRSDRAPVTEGEVMGMLTYFPREGNPAEYELYATRSIAARKDAPPSLEEIQRATLADPNPFPRFSLEFVMVPAVGLLVVTLIIRLLHTRMRRPRRDEDRKKRRTKRKQAKELPKPKVRSFR